MFTEFFQVIGFIIFVYAVIQTACLTLQAICYVKQNLRVQFTRKNIFQDEPRLGERRSL